MTEIKMRNKARYKISKLLINNQNTFVVYQNTFANHANSSRKWK